MEQGVWTEKIKDIFVSENSSIWKAKSLNAAMWGLKNLVIFGSQGQGKKPPEVHLNKLVLDWFQLNCESCAVVLCLNSVVQTINM